MKQWKKYLPGAVLIITFVCILFFIAINRHNDISGNTDSSVFSQKKEMPALLKSRHEKFYTGKNIEDPAAKVITRNKMLSSLKTSDMPESVKEQIADYLAETDIPEANFNAKSFWEQDNDNMENTEVLSPHLAKFTKDYNIPSSQWRHLLESFQTIHDPGNRQEMTYKSSRLMDMGITMLLNKDYEKAEDAFMAVVRMDTDNCSDAVKWAKAGLIRSLAAQGRNDEAMNEKSITLNICDNDEEFISFLERLPIL